MTDVRRLPECVWGDCDFAAVDGEFCKRHLPDKRYDPDLWQFLRGIEQDALHRWGWHPTSPRMERLNDLLDRYDPSGSGRPEKKPNPQSCPTCGGVKNHRPGCKDTWAAFEEMGG